MFKVCCIVEVGDVDAGPGRGVGALHRRQLLQLGPPQLLLGAGAERQARLACAGYRGTLRPGGSLETVRHITNSAAGEISTTASC